MIPDSYCAELVGKVVTVYTSVDGPGEKMTGRLVEVTDKVLILDDIPGALFGAVIPRSVVVAIGPKTRKK